MVVQGLIALALALPTGMLFGVGYGTGVRIGYEQVYPLLFPKAAGTQPDATQVKTNLQAINRIYDTIGGKEASNMGIAMGLNSVRSATENNPDFRYLEELESRISGRTPSSLDPHNKSSTTTSSAPVVSSDINLTLDEKMQLINVIENADMATLLRMKQQYTDLNLLQIIRTRINKLAETQRIENPQENIVPKSPVISTGSIKVTDSYVKAQYQNKVFTFIQAIKQITIQVNHQAKTGNARGVQLTTAQLDRKIKELQNFITQSRNNIKLKSLANNDWNKRIWIL